MRICRRHAHDTIDKIPLIYRAVGRRIAKWEVCSQIPLKLIGFVIRSLFFFWWAITINVILIIVFAPGRYVHTYSQEYPGAASEDTTGRTQEFHQVFPRYF